MLPAGAFALIAVLPVSDPCPMVFPGTPYSPN